MAYSESQVWFPSGAQFWTTCSTLGAHPSSPWTVCRSEQGASHGLLWLPWTPSLNPYPNGTVPNATSIFVPASESCRRRPDDAAGA